MPECIFQLLYMSLSIMEQLINRKFDQYYAE